MKVVVTTVGLAFLVGTTFTVIAEEGAGTTKPKFVKTRMEWARNNPNWKPTREELEAKFATLDVNKDGLLTEEDVASKKSAKE